MIESTFILKRRRYVWAAVLALAVTVLAACGGENGGTATQSPSGAAQSGTAPVDVKFGVPGTSFALVRLLLANSTGVFKDNGINANLIQVSSGAQAVTSLVSGDVDVANAGIADALTARAKGQDLKVIASVYPGPAGILVLNKSVANKLGVKANASVANRVKALNGLTIATPSATSSYTSMLNGVAAKAGIQVKLTYLDQTAMPAAVKTGAIDGFLGASPYPEITVSAGSGVVWLSGPKGEFPADVSSTATSATLTTGAYAKAHPEVIKRIIAAYQEAGKMVASGDKRVTTALKQLYPQLDSGVLSAAVSTNKSAWSASPLVTEAGVQHEIDLLKSGSANVSGINNVKAKDLLLG